MKMTMPGQIPEKTAEKIFNFFDFFRLGGIAGVKCKRNRPHAKFIRERGGTVTLPRHKSIKSGTVKFTLNRIGIPTSEVIFAYHQVK